MKNASLLLDANLEAGRAAKLFHTYGLGNSLTFPMSAGATTVQVSGPSKPDRILETITRHHTTLFFSVPRTATGKIQRFKLREAEAAPPALA
jgi:acyl-coenzyme A synthetase/AMP-(fatty) acid ligase